MAKTPLPAPPPLAYTPYAGDYSTYGLGPEWNFFGTGTAVPPATTTPPPGTTPPGTTPPPAGGGDGFGPRSQGQGGTGFGSSNEGGARGADRGWSPLGGGPPSDSPLGGGTPMSPGTGAYASMPGWLDSVTSAAGALLPFPYSAPFTVGREAARGYNMLGPTNENRQMLGEEPLSGWQMLGGMLGTGYGNLTNPEISNAEQMQGKLPSGWDYGVTQYGGEMPGFQLGPFQIGGGDPTLDVQQAWEMHNMKVGDDEAAAGTLQPWKLATGPLGGKGGGSGSKNESKGGGNNNGQGSLSPGGGLSQQGNAGGAQSNASSGGGNDGGPDSAGTDARGDHMARGGLADVRPMTLRRSRHPGKQRRALPGFTPHEPRRLLAAGAPNPPLPGGLGSVAQFDKGGFVRSRGAGRADSVNTKVPENTYIFPADYVAARGQGNSLHGAHVIDHLVRRVTARPQLAGGGRLPRPGKKTVPVALSGGEYRAPPHFVYAVGGGDYDRGSAYLDHEVTSTRARFAQHLQSLPPPKK